MVKYMGPIYPTVSQASEPGDKFYYFDGNKYEGADVDGDIAKECAAIGESNAPLREWYLSEGDDPMQPHVSPITASMDSLPKALVITAEYDYLRLECEALSRKLEDAKVSQRHIRYGGITHGTFDRFGYMPQVEDMLVEIAKDMRGLK